MRTEAVAVSYNYNAQSQTLSGKAEENDKKSQSGEHVAKNQTDITKMHVRSITT
jgi:hypothetical protein